MQPPVCSALCVHWVTLGGYSPLEIGFFISHSSRSLKTPGPFKDHVSIFQCELEMQVGSELPFSGTKLCKDECLYLFFMESKYPNDFYIWVLGAQVGNADFILRGVTYIVNSNCGTFWSMVWIIDVCSIMENKSVECLLENGHWKNTAQPIPVPSRVKGTVPSRVKGMETFPFISWLRDARVETFLLWFSHPCFLAALWIWEICEASKTDWPGEPGQRRFEVPHPTWVVGAPSRVTCGRAWRKDKFWN